MGLALVDVLRTLGVKRLGPVEVRELENTVEQFHRGVPLLQNADGGIFLAEESLDRFQQRSHRRICDPED